MLRRAGEQLARRIGSRQAMKRILLTVALTVCALTARVFAQPHEPAPSAGHEAGAASVEHEKQVPLLPNNGQEFKEYFMGPAIWTIVIFLIMLAILYPTAWKNVLAGLKKREERIRKDIADAEAARAKAEDTLREYSQQLSAAEGRVRDMLSKATQDGERLAAQIRAQAQKEAEEIRERNAKDIEAGKHAAIREIHESAVDLSTRIAEKILKRNLNPDDQRELVRSSLEQLSSVAKN
jgi:F-type H+-transporting ATPase subunit b